MVRLTLIARTRDGLPLAEGLDADKEHEMYAYKSQAKVGRVGKAAGCCCPDGRWRRQRQAVTCAACPGFIPSPACPVLQGIFKKMAASTTKPPERMSIESGPFTFHYLIDGGEVGHPGSADRMHPACSAADLIERQGCSG